jgi:hypothetical protein
VQPASCNVPRAGAPVGTTGTHPVRPAVGRDLSRPDSSTGKQKNESPSNTSAKGSPHPQVAPCFSTCTHASKERQDLCQIPARTARMPAALI